MKPKNRYFILSIIHEWAASKNWLVEQVFWHGGEVVDVYAVDSSGASHLAEFDVDKTGMRASLRKLRH